VKKINRRSWLHVLSLLANAIENIAAEPKRRYCESRTVASAPRRAGVANRGYQPWPGVGAYL